MKEEIGEEEILLEIKPSRKRFIVEYSVALVMVVLSLVIYYRSVSIPIDVDYIHPEIFLPVFLLINSFILILYAEFRRKVEEYILTDYAVFEKIGIINKRMTNLPYIKLERCDLEEPFIERIVGIGDVRVDAGKDFFIIKGISRPEDIRDKIRSQMRRVMSGGNVAAVVHD